MSEEPTGTAKSGLRPSMELAWGLRERPARGPKRGLTLAEIVDAGIAIAVAEGFGAVSMARVAKAVGVSTMALYRYVGAKDELLELMVDAALDTPPQIADDEHWRAGLLRWATAVRDGYRANQWTLRVPFTGPPLGPNNIRWLEQALRAMRGVALTPPQKLSAVMTITSFVRGEELLLADLVQANVMGEDPAEYPRQLARLIDERDFPEVTAVLVAGAMDDEEQIDHDFDFGITRILDGLEALVASATAGREGAG